MRKYTLVKTILPKAQIAFQERRYSDYIKIVSKDRDILPDLFRKKLQYAERHNT